jgi:predicted metal-binding membrane protein
MMRASLEAVLRRDRLVVAASLIVLTVIAWAYILWLARTMSMDGMTAPGIRMNSDPFGAAMIASLQPWGARELVLALVMWSVMMVGMMTPSAAPMILIYARVGRQAELRGKPLAATGYFAGGYLLAWIAFSLLATIGQWALGRAMLFDPMMHVTSNVLGGIVLIGAGVFQWTPAKAACLKQCQAPMTFIQRHGGFRRRRVGSLKLGFHHGLYCVGCCWALMALLFVGGIMNVLWIAGIAGFVLAEKVMSVGRTISRLAGGALIAAGGWLITSSFF